MEEKSFSNPFDYSLSHYLQSVVKDLVARHPQHFASLDEWVAFRESFLARLRQELGMPFRSPMRSHVVEAIECEGCLRERVAFLFDRDCYVAAHVWSCPAVEGRKPGIVLSPGWPQHKWNETFNQLGLRWATEGFVVAILDHAPFGERERTDLEMTNLVGVGAAVGMPNIGLRAFEDMRALDYLASRPDVDPERIGITGLCQGGMDTWLAGALEERFKAVCPVCSATTHEAWALDFNCFGNLGDVSPYIPNLLKHGDVHHIHASIAPRPLLVQANINDNWWPLSGYRKIVNLCQEVYALYEASDRFRAFADCATHNIAPPFDGRVTEWFKKWL
jgi:dienelactone hydrolase